VSHCDGSNVLAALAVLALLVLFLDEVLPNKASD
jgi:hypothetical protein